jgi:hypothetical protein
VQKLKLDLENLSVESFAVLPSRLNGRGTVAGNELEGEYIEGEGEIVGDLEGDAEFSKQQPSQKFSCTLSLIWAMCTTI